eukprot:2588793-Pyramimonas_sp.AAC.2
MDRASSSANIQATSAGIGLRGVPANRTRSTRVFRSDESRHCTETLLAKQLLVEYHVTQNKAMYRSEVRLEHLRKMRTICRSRLPEVLVIMLGLARTS